MPRWRSSRSPVTVATKMLRLELLKTKAELERGLSEFVLDCTACGMEVQAYPR